MTPILPVPNKPTDAEKIILAEYIESLKTRGFCKIDDASSNSTKLYNHINGNSLPLSFIDNDFNYWLNIKNYKCDYHSILYIIR